MTVNVLKGAKLLDFTGRVAGAEQLEPFGDGALSQLRALTQSVFVIVDEEAGQCLSAPVVVRDHLNLTGWSPLVGDNFAGGDRFPVVQGVYIEDKLELPRDVVAGIKQGQVLSDDDTEFVKGLGAGCCSYNLVPAMLAVAQQRKRVLGIVVPKGGTLPQPILRQINQLISE